jgi:hypothetical protein
MTAFSSIWRGDLSLDRTVIAENERKGCFGIMPYVSEGEFHVGANVYFVEA